MTEPDPIRHLLGRYPDLAPCEADLVAVLAALIGVYRAGGKLLVCGNGGSASDAEHIVGELMKGVMLKRPLPAALQARLVAEHGPDGALLAGALQGALPAIALTSHPALSTAFANDVHPELGFAQQVYGYGRAGDALLAISTSGLSANVLHAARAARTLGLTTIGLTGRTGGHLIALCDLAIRVPADVTPEVQERHLPIYHALCLGLEAAFFTS